jgi:hypothetical protein
MLNVFPAMKTPPFLLLAALLFWGWLTDFLVIGAVMGVLLEAARFVAFRWDLDDADFSRIWGFCTILNIAVIAYVFTNNEAGGLYDMVNGNTVNTVANSSVLTATRFLRWLPMTTFIFMLAQQFNVRSSVPLTAISLVLRWRHQRGDAVFANRHLNISFPYFIVCLFSAGIQTNVGTQFYFWGQAGLLAWALWSVRPARFGILVWLAMLALVCGLGFAEMVGINQMQKAFQNFNSQWLARFFPQRTDPLQTMTSMGRIGDLKLSPKIVIWLQPHAVGCAPSYLREASYRNYEATRAAWYAGGSRADFEPLQSETNGTTWILLPEKKATNAVNIACYLTGWSREMELPGGLLPLPSGCGRLENVPPYMILKENKNGAVMAAGSGLAIFDAFYGGGATIDSPPDVNSTNRFDLRVATNEIPALQTVIQDLNLPAHADEALKLRVLEKYFLDHFTYSTWQGRDKKATADATPLTKFLTTSRSGHCEYFASATVLLLRQMGIPARYAVGYYVHETRGSGYVVRARDAHAWCLVWNAAGKHWEDFDTTPPSWVAVEGQRSHVREWLSDLGSWLKFQFAKFRWRQAHLQQYIFWTLIPVLLVLLYYIIFRRRGKLLAYVGKKAETPDPGWPGLDSEFYQLEKQLGARGVLRQPGETLSDWLERALIEPSQAELRGPLRELLRLHYRHRFDPHGLKPVEREELRRLTAVALEMLSPASSKR